MRKTGLGWLWISMVIFLLDRASKVAAEHYLTAYLPWPLAPSFNLTLAYNKGAAFSFLHSGSGWQVILFSSIALLIVGVLLWWLRQLPAAISFKTTACVMIIGGALGNVWDRVCYGHVIDFIQLYYQHFYWPTFNLADSAICVGAFLLLIDQLKQKN